MKLVERIVALHAHLRDAGVPHAFGGALALAWCTERARATIDIDLNVFVPPHRIDDVAAALPEGIEVTPADRTAIATDGQTRLWWDATPVDLFCSTTPFHDDVARRVRVEEFAGAQVPFLACRDIAVFKAFFDRTKDWADLEEMSTAGTLELEPVIGVLTIHLGGDDPRIERLRSLI
jgi:hypothetical protein